MLGFACLFVLLGGVFMLSDVGEDILPTRMHLSAANIQSVSGEYFINVYKKETPLMVSTRPRGSSRRVTFNILSGEDCLSITPRAGIWPGAYATLTLLADANGSYQFGRPVKIVIQSNQLMEVLNVRICLPPDQVTFDFKIRHRITGTEVAAIPVQDYKQDLYGGTNNAMPVKSDSLYRFHPELRVFGTAVRSSLVKFEAVPQDAGCRARLLDILKEDPNFPELMNGFPYNTIYIPMELLLNLNTEPIRFKITATYMEQEFVAFYDLFIV